MQAFKLVNGGFVDRVIVFDSLPERLLQGVRTRPADGFPRAWAKWLTAIGSTRTVFKTDTVVDLARNWTFKHTPIGKEPCFFVLDYTDINADKQRWREISEYIRMNVSTDIRLKEKLEDMSMALAPNPTAELSIEPEDIYDLETNKGGAFIPVPKEKANIPEAALVAPGEQIIVKESAPKKKPGRPKKEAVEV